MESNLMMFQFNAENSVHVEMESNDAWFVAADITTALGYSRANDPLRVLDKDEKKLIRARRVSGSLKQGREMWYVNESGLYHLIFMSEKPEAKVFRKWVTSVVLPQIRKTGMYGTSFSGLVTYEHEGQKMYRYADVLNELGFKKSGSNYKVQERYPKDFAHVDGTVLVSENYALVKACRRRATTILKGIKERQLELPFEKEVANG